MTEVPVMLSGTVSIPTPPTAADIRQIIRDFLTGQVTYDSVNDKLVIGTVAPPPSPPPPVAASIPFHHYQEYFGDGGATATQQTNDLLVPSASFRAIPSSGETVYWDNHHDIVLCTILPHDLISPAADAFLQQWYPDSTDPNYRTTMPALARRYGFENTYMFLFPEGDNDPGDQGWAKGRFLEGGVTGSRPDIPSGLSRDDAYRWYMHFYLANNHDGNSNHHQLGQILNTPAQARGYQTSGNCVYQSGMYYAFEMGLDLVTNQKNNSDLPGIVGGLAMPRGAARQYGKKWGIDMSATAPSGQLAYSGSTLTGGWSTATYRRHRFLAWGSGADVLAEEAVTWSGSAVTINGHGYHPGAAELRYFCDFTRRHPYQHRGTPHVPIALVKDHTSKLEPKGGPNGQSRAVWWWQMAPNGAENFIHNFYEMAWPNYFKWGLGSTSPGGSEPMGSGRWGEQFDVITDRASADVLANYKVIILATNAPISAAMQATLDAYVRNGGIVVINAKQLTGTAHSSLTGITLAGTGATAGTVTWGLDGTTTAESPFNYTLCTLGTATRIASSGTSTTQIARNLVGSGEVWTVLPDWYSNATNSTALGVTAKLTDYFINRFAVATVSGGNHVDIDWTVGKQGGENGTANIVTIVNTRDPGGTAWTGTISFPQGGPVEEWTTGTVPPSVDINGRTVVSAMVPAGDVRVYRVG